MPPLGVRETSTQLRWPRQRNWWVETADGKRVNSSTLLHAADGSARERRIGRVGRHAVRLAVIGGELALHFFATTKVGAYYYVLSSLGMLTAATAVEAWGKRPRKAAGDGGEATAAVPAAPLLQ